MEAGRSDTVVDPALLEPLAVKAGRLFPALAGKSYEGAAGVRMATPDGLPIAGPSREPKVLLASGARRNGWLVAPLVARTIVAHITGRDPGPHAARLDPARF
jgi:glycine oxidase